MYVFNFFNNMRSVCYYYRFIPLFLKTVPDWGAYFVRKPFLCTFGLTKYEIQNPKLNHKNMGCSCYNFSGKYSVKGSRGCLYEVTGVYYTHRLNHFVWLLKLPRENGFKLIIFIYYILKMGMNIVLRMCMCLFRYLTAKLIFTLYVCLPSI